MCYGQLQGWNISIIYLKIKFIIICMELMVMYKSQSICALRYTNSCEAFVTFYKDIFAYGLWHLYIQRSLTESYFKFWIMIQCITVHHESTTAMVCSWEQRSSIGIWCIGDQNGGIWYVTPTSIKRGNRIRPIKSVGYEKSPPDIWDVGYSRPCDHIYWLKQKKTTKILIITFAAWLSSKNLYLINLQ